MNGEQKALRSRANSTGPKTSVRSGRRRDNDQRIVKVVDLNQRQIKNVLGPDRFKAPRDQDVFVRCQKIVIAYCMYHAGDINISGSPQMVYKKARQMARPLAALAARIPLTAREMAANAFWIHDAIASWAEAKDEAAHALATLFLAFAVPREGKSLRDVGI